MSSYYLNTIENINENEKLDEDIKYNCVIIDDMANLMKDKDIFAILNKLLIKSRQLNTMFIFTLQSFYHLPKLLRKMTSNIILFKPNNYQEWESISKELFNLDSKKAIYLFNYIFDEMYNHLDIDLKLNNYFKNFNKLIFK